MIRLIAVAFALALATSAHAMPLAPLQQADGTTTLVRLGCGPGRTVVAGQCVARTTVRHTAESSAETFEHIKDAEAFEGIKDETGDALPLGRASIGYRLRPPDVPLWS
jgi:hypothetical protein